MAESMREGVQRVIDEAHKDLVTSQERITAKESPEFAEVIAETFGNVVGLIRALEAISLELADHIDRLEGSDG
jgi:hypothetical protein